MVGTYAQLFVPREGFTAGVGKRYEFLIHIFVHIGGDPLIHHKVNAIAAHVKAEQKDRHVIAGEIFHDIHSGAAISLRILTFAAESETGSLRAGTGLHFPWHFDSEFVFRKRR
jgi:hypothetical protein